MVRKRKIEREKKNGKNSKSAERGFVE